MGGALSEVSGVGGIVARGMSGRRPRWTASSAMESVSVGARCGQKLRYRMCVGMHSPSTAGAALHRVSAFPCVAFLASIAPPSRCEEFGLVKGWRNVATPTDRPTDCAGGTPSDRRQDRPRDGPPDRPHAHDRPTERPADRPVGRRIARPTALAPTTDPSDRPIAGSTHLDRPIPIDRPPDRLTPALARPAARPTGRHTDRHLRRAPRPTIARDQGVDNGACARRSLRQSDIDYPVV